MTPLVGTASLVRLALRRDRLMLLLWGVLESLGYRQLTAFWRIRGRARHLRGHADWGAMEREGFRAASEP